ncbi:transcriptional regulator, Crp/Fnr family [Fulvivirga imtechensis AK7]|uniref:Transcriptional regulator, Crp/Fnr family n=1 Tax=Fulvivirga imtechensis AK7 TaxID=1237149 RepID=L8JWK3_9BACT|nr:Crp/Fnr family transcriptional regulator [Fulvivirga imtechensis]ELR71999.1 transcriptional regulator, Crp/Fnr family [Fulvivirga imtechensis AK7]
MTIDTSTLQKYGARQVSLKKNEILFLEGSSPLNYYQVAEGVIKMNNFSSDGQEFIQGMFKEGESFGEPPLFGNFPYPANADAVIDSVVWKLSKDNFIDLLKENFELHLKFCSILSKRLQFKAMIAKEISSYTPEHRIMTLIDYFKEKEDTPELEYEVPFTRQQIADMTGLRVETVIRTVKALARKKELKIVNRKVFRD